MIKFKDDNYIQAVLVAPGEVRPSLQEISAKITVRLARQEGSASWFALIKSPSNVQSGLLASAIGSSNPIVVVPPQFQSLFDSYSIVFEEPREPAPGQVTHRIDLLDESSMLPRQWAYRMSLAQLAESYK